jgi:hypothetical protein
MRLISLIVVLVAVVATIATGASATASSGIRGNVTRGPTSPVCRAGMSCTGPAGGIVLVAFRSGRQVAKTRTTEAGTFRFVLSPGVYVVRTLRTSMANSFAARTVRVRPGRFTISNFEIDTGIR